MPKQRNTHRIGGDIPRRPYLFVLPGDLRKVKVWAFTGGILNAFNAWPMRPESESEQFISAAAISSALMYEEIVYQGKQGTNKPQEFRKVFSDFCAVIHPAVTRLFVEQPSTYKSLLGLNEEKRNAVAFELAERYIDTVEKMIAAGEQIEFEW
jgi:hypothetical protein